MFRVPHSTKYLLDIAKQGTQAAQKPVKNATSIFSQLEDAIPSVPPDSTSSRNSKSINKNSHKFQTPPEFFSSHCYSSRQAENKNNYTSNNESHSNSSKPMKYAIPVNVRRKTRRRLYKTEDKFLSKGVTDLSSKTPEEICKEQSLPPDWAQVSRESSLTSLMLDKLNRTRLTYTFNSSNFREIREKISRGEEITDPALKSIVDSSLDLTFEKQFWWLDHVMVDWSKILVETGAFNFIKKNLICEGFEIHDVNNFISLIKDKPKDPVSIQLVDKFREIALDALKRYLRNSQMMLNVRQKSSIYQKKSLQHAAPVTSYETSKLYNPNVNFVYRPDFIQQLFTIACFIGDTHLVSRLWSMFDIERLRSIYVLKSPAILLNELEIQGSVYDNMSFYNDSSAQPKKTHHFGMEQNREKYYKRVTPLPSVLNAKLMLLALEATSCDILSSVLIHQAAEVLHLWETMHSSPFEALEKQALKEFTSQIRESSIRYREKIDYMKLLGPTHCGFWDSLDARELLKKARRPDIQLAPEIKQPFSPNYLSGGELNFLIFAVGSSLYSHIESKSEAFLETMMKDSPSIDLFSSKFTDIGLWSKNDLFNLRSELNDGKTRYPMLQQPLEELQESITSIYQDQGLGYILPQDQVKRYTKREDDTLSQDINTLDDNDKQDIRNLTTLYQDIFLTNTQAQASILVYDAINGKTLHSSALKPSSVINKKDLDKPLQYFEYFDLTSWVLDPRPTHDAVTSLLLCRHTMKVVQTVPWVAKTIPSIDPLICYGYPRPNVLSPTFLELTTITSRLVQTGIFYSNDNRPPPFLIHSLIILAGLTNSWGLIMKTLGLSANLRIGLDDLMLSSLAQSAYLCRRPYHAATALDIIIGGQYIAPNMNILMKHLYSNDDKVYDPHANFNSFSWCKMALDEFVPYYISKCNSTTYEQFQAIENEEKTKFYSIDAPHILANDILPRFLAIDSVSLKLTPAVLRAHFLTQQYHTLLHGYSRFSELYSYSHAHPVYKYETKWDSGSRVLIGTISGTAPRVESRKHRRPISGIIPILLFDTFIRIRARLPKNPPNDLSDTRLATDYPLLFVDVVRELFTPSLWNNISKTYGLQYEDGMFTFSQNKILSNSIIQENWEDFSKLQRDIVSTDSIVKLRERLGEVNMTWEEFYQANGVELAYKLSANPMFRTPIRSFTEQFSLSELSDEQFRGITKNQFIAFFIWATCLQQIPRKLEYAIFPLALEPKSEPPVDVLNIYPTGGIKYQQYSNLSNSPISLLSMVNLIKHINQETQDLIHIPKSQPPPDLNTYKYTQDYNKFSKTLEKMMQSQVIEEQIDDDELTDLYRYI